MSGRTTEVEYPIFEEIHKIASNLNGGIPLNLALENIRHKNINRLI